MMCMAMSCKATEEAKIRKENEDEHVITAFQARICSSLYAADCIRHRTINQRTTLHQTALLCTGYSLAGASSFLGNAIRL